ncbi:hypothetical protein [Kribbella hippodromi]|uniref:hypothetical protein n=1 Tax=Kribbella hippodromi TaxID=434347 RepID=UPI0031DCCBC6
MLKKLSGVGVSAIGMVTTVIAPREFLLTAVVFLVGGLLLLAEAAFGSGDNQSVSLAALVAAAGVGAGQYVKSGWLVDLLAAGRIPIVVVGAIGAVVLSVAAFRRRPPPRYDPRDLRGV